MKKNSGKLKTYTGPMFAAKTSMLLGDLVEKEAKYLIRPTFDKRYSDDDVITHDGISAKEAGLIVLLKEPNWNILEDKEFQQMVFNEKVSIVGIDEAQFFVNINQIITWLILNNINVISSCLNLASDGTLLQESGQVIAMADEHVVLTSTCVKCGSKANRTYRKNQQTNNEKVVVAGSELYQPMCITCWFIANNSKVAEV